jgi:uncharacterized pyridoxal phosphate-containing UPF0001 family protein
MNEIIIRLCDEDRARLDRIAGALERYPHKCESCAKSVATYVATAVNVAHEESKNEPVQSQLDEAAVAADHPVEGVDAFTPVTPKETPTVKLADIQQKVVALSAAGKKTEVKAIVNVYAERVTLLPEDKFVEVYEKLTALEKE